jgi:uncharacterized protein (TIRG00374 family)
LTQAETASSPKRQRILIGIIVIVALIGVIFVASDWEDFRKVLSAADWRMILPGLFFSAVSYFCVGVSYAIGAKLLEIRMSWRDLTEIGFVTVILNHIITTGGVAGFSVRYLLMERHGIRMRDVLSSSFLHFYLSSVVIIAILPFCFIYLLDNATLPKGVALLIGFATSVVIVISIIGALLFFVNQIRAPVLKVMGKAANLFTRHDIHTRFEQFNDTMNQSAAITRSRPLNVLAILVIVIIQWSAAFVTMGFCFDALGAVPPPGVLVTGLVIGLVAGVLSMVPGGFGVQEASMAGIYALLGVPFELALLAAILFRGVYYLVPYVVSLIFYGRLLRTGQKMKGKRPRREDTIIV